VVDQGERAYVERIEIRGNTATRDYVIRREFDMAEGDAYNQERVADAKRRLERLGYFSKVDISTQPGSAPDRVILVVDVVDQSTGTFGIGAGYATGGEGFILEASIEEKNFLGRGQYIRVSASGGALTRNYSISFTEPYFLGYRLAAGFDLFKSSNSIQENYAYADQGFSLRVAAPITNDISTTFRYNYKELRYTSDSYYRLSQPYRRVVDGSPWVQSTVSNTVTYNTLDTAMLPHEGILASLTQEIAGLGGDSRFYRVSGRARGYYTISDEMDLIGSLSTSAGHVVSLDGKALNVFDQFSLDSNDIRGFADSGIGPRMRGDPIGGTTYMTASAEMTFPLPGISQDSGFRGGFFVDAGTLFGNDVKVKEPTKGKLHGVGMDWRVATGASLIWASPFGPLRIDYAIPVMKQDHDIVQNLKFGISTAF
jgi:outer membrane protein insertion porin family